MKTREEILDYCFKYDARDIVDRVERHFLEKNPCSMEEAESYTNRDEIIILNYGGKYTYFLEDDYKRMLDQEIENYAEEIKKAIIEEINERK